MVDPAREDNGGVAIADSDLAEENKVVFDEVFDVLVGGVYLAVRTTAVEHHEGMLPLFYPALDDYVRDGRFVLMASREAGEDSEKENVCPFRMCHRY